MSFRCGPWIKGAKLDLTDLNTSAPPLAYAVLPETRHLQIEKVTSEMQIRRAVPRDCAQRLLADEIRVLRGESQNGILGCRAQKTAISPKARTNRVTLAMKDSAKR